MIVSFGSKVTDEIYHGLPSKRTQKFAKEIVKIAERKLDLINASTSVVDLKVPPGNRLKALKGDRKGFYSIRINDQFRIIFQFQNGNAYKVEVVDYH